MRFESNKCVTIFFKELCLLTFCQKKKKVILGYYFIVSISTYSTVVWNVTAHTNVKWAYNAWLETNLKLPWMSLATELNSNVSLYPLWKFRDHSKFKWNNICDNVEYLTSILCSGGFANMLPGHGVHHNMGTTKCPIDESCVVWVKYN